MRILLVSEEFPPVTDYSGGIGFHFATTASELARQGHQVAVLTGPRGRSGAIDPPGIDVTCLTSASRVLPTRVGRGRQVRDWISAHRDADVIFAPEWGGEAASVAGDAGLPPLVTNLATSLQQIRAIQAERLGAETVVKDRIQAWLERRQAERSSGILACTSAILRWARDIWAIERVPSVVLPNFVDPESVRENAQGELPLGWPEQAPVVLFLGRLERRKGVEVLARAIPLVLSSIPDAQFVFAGADTEVGGEAMTERVLRLAGVHGRGTIQFLGPQPPRRLMPAVAAASVVALPSLWENFSIAALEARALGRPLVATAGSGFDDFVTHEQDGLLVPPGDAAALAESVIRLLEDRGLRDRLGAEAARLAGQYAPDTVVTKYVAFFEAVANR